MGIEKRIKIQRKRLTEKEKEILYSDFRNDSDIYKTKSGDIVRVESYGIGERGEVVIKSITKQEYDERVRKIFDVKFY